MFVISTISDSHVRIVPENLAKSRAEAVSDAIEQIYVDKVHTSPRLFKATDG
jgi:DNA-directed RNA polymerase subunit E'/Rpb7